LVSLNASITFPAIVAEIPFKKGIPIKRKCCYKKEEK
jgi:hypothetical protein